VPEHVLLYLYSGEQVIEDGNKITTIKAGECAFIRRNHRMLMHKNNVGEEHYEGISLVLNRKVLREMHSRMSKSEIPKNIVFMEDNVLKLESGPAIISLFQSLLPYFDDQTKLSAHVAQLKIQEGIYALLNNADSFFPILFDFTEPWKIDILEFLNESYMDDLRIEQIAAYTGRSLATFKRDFKKISHLSPQRWLIKKRLEAAYLKLKEENKKAKEVFVEVGFKNYSHFSTAFKKQYGISPSSVRRSA